MSGAPEHPQQYVVLRYRSKRRTLNLAFATRGRSSGWGSGRWGRTGEACKPSRWFVGHHRSWSFHRGFELVVHNGFSDERTILAYEWGASAKPVSHA